ncbi:hypothetical protein EVAR_29128_1 [Eumeta japonica]|uniref:Uncharacterized protein n=1 Tax=Eumeta variegata TaxID=151549 RepID=A0A4C1VAX9_EUMVA|nr:hypothetical protein EVAR_29128_1 [Eumeta japonica]
MPTGKKSLSTYWRERPLSKLTVVRDAHAHETDGFADPLASARDHCACAVGRWREASGLNGWCSTRGGREAQLKLDTQPTAGGRTLVDADRIKAARIGDPRRRRSNRARLPTANQAIHASNGSSRGSTCQRAASFNLLVLSHPGSRCQSGAYAGPPAGARVIAHALNVGWRGTRLKRRLTRAGAELDRRMQTTAARRTPMNADHVEAARTGDSTAAPEAARVSEPLSSSSRSGPRPGSAPRRLQHGRRAARRTSATGKRRGGRSALCTSGMAAVPSRLHFNELECGNISFGAVV